jgi:hypothetical protein
MSEEFLKQLPVKELFDLMLKTMDELISMHKEGESESAITEKRYEVETLQRVIVAKRAAEQPLK